MPIEEAKKSYHHQEIEKEISDFWEKNQIYLKTQNLRKNNQKYSFLDGPPYCSGKIHLGTAQNKIVKDAFLRFKSMKGFNVRRQAGWDTHGLPIEHKVEQLLGIKNKQQIEEDIGIANFVAKCKEFSLENKNFMTQQFKDLGVWMDWDSPYITLDPKYMESCWWTLKKAHEKNLLLKDKRVISWCPRCETALAAAEIDYEDKEDRSIYVKFQLKEPFLACGNNPENLKEFFLVWTTTPWTLPANLAICVNEEFDYSFIKINDEILILASDLVETIFGPPEKISKIKKETSKFDENGEELVEIEEKKDVIYEVLKVVKGEDLKFRKYIYPLLEEVASQNDFDKGANVHRILIGEHVELDEGTGLVHTAPGHGPDDFEIGKKYDLPVFCPVNDKGNFTDDGGKYEDEFVKNTDLNIINDLKNHGNLVKDEIIKHRYGHCWRCKTPIIYLATEQWFLKITEIKDKMLSEIDKIEWIPSWAGESRFKDWVDNAKDWTISRQRYWGIPIPIWVCSVCGHTRVLGSLKELKENSIYEIAENDENLVHRPYVDEIIIKCDNKNCNGKMNRVEDVLDVWIDSGVAGWAATYYPQEKELFNEWYPYDFITEAHDQTRGWFYSQLGTGVIALDRSPYEKVLMQGFVLDEHGKKMSKSLGNVVNPEDVVEQYGADVLRFYILWARKPWDDLKFVWDELKNVKKMFNILWNVYVFSTTYMSLDEFDPANCSEDDNRMNLKDEDRWIISKVNSLAMEVEEDLNKLFFHKATRKINSFILEDLSRWYVRLIRGRTWIEKEDPNKLGAYFGLYSALEILIKTMAPITPYISEKIYSNLIKGMKDSMISIHMEDWKYDKEAIDIDLEKKMDIARNIIESCSRARDVAKYKLRWPIKDITIVSTSEKVFDAVNHLKNVIKDQANTKEIFTANEYKNIKFQAKPNLKTLGPKLKQDMTMVAKFLKENDGNDIKKNLEANGKIYVKIASQDEDEKIIELSANDILFETELPEDIVSAEFDGGSVYLNTHITPDILSESMARELIRRIQNMRKDMDLDVEANIFVALQLSNDLKDIIANQVDFIANEVRAKNISFDSSDIDNIDIVKSKEYKKRWKIEDEELLVQIRH